MIEPGGPDRPREYPDWVRGELGTERAQEIFRMVPSAVAVVAAVGGALGEPKPVAMVVSSFTTGVSFDPPMCLISVQHQSTTWPILNRAEVLGVSLLGDRHQETVMRIGSRDQSRRLDGIDWTRLPSGAVMIYDSPLWIEARIVHRYPAGDHTVIVLGVEGYSIAPEFAALMSHQQTFGIYPYPAA